MRRSLLLLVSAGALATHADVRAEDAGSAGARPLHVVAHVGAVSITVGDIENRIASMPRFQRANFGRTKDAVRRRFVDEVLVPDSLLALAAEAQKLGEQPPAAYELERARSAATIRAVRARVGSAAAIALADVEHYYDENRARYDAPERYQIWRILCKTTAEAQSVLESAKREPTPINFATLAREHSLDKATSLRAGNLGFVASDGSSNEPGLRVEPSVVHAARSVPDGGLVPAPVAEGDYFSVVWRRGTIAATKRTLDEVQASIRDALWKGRVKQETDKLVSKLRAERLRSLDAPFLLTIDLPAENSGALPSTTTKAAGSFSAAR